MSKSSGPPRVPKAMRPGETDDVLEGSRLNKVMLWGFLTVFFFALFIPVYWFVEPTRMASKEKKFLDESIERGKKYFALREDRKTGAENFDGVECARCHGSNATGGTNDFLNPNTGTRSLVTVPGLTTVFDKWNKNKESFGYPVVKDAKQFVTETIERGRPGTDMPTWGNKWGGPLTDQQIADIANYLETIQEPLKKTVTGDGKTLFNQICASCHGPDGAGGGIGPAFKDGGAVKRFPNRDEQIAFVKSGSVANTLYGVGGVGTGQMPPKGGMPALTDAQIAQIVDYERSL